MRFGKPRRRRATPDCLRDLRSRSVHGEEEVTRLPDVEADMGTSEAECLEALRDAAEELGESPTKAAYEELGLTPASATIVRVIGGWNEAKREAGLSTNPSTGRRVGPQPDDVTLPDGTDWEDLSVDQRWHYRNVEWNTERTLNRRARLRSWVNEYRRTRGCLRCGEDDPACLDCHHRNQSEKEMAVGRMITYGYGKQKLRDGGGWGCRSNWRTRRHGRQSTPGVGHRIQTSPRVYEVRRDESPLSRLPPRGRQASDNHADGRGGVSERRGADRDRQMRAPLC
jgi:hypothetical protein